MVRVTVREWVVDDNANIATPSYGDPGFEESLNSKPGWWICGKAGAYQAILRKDGAAKAALFKKAWEWNIEQAAPNNPKGVDGTPPRFKPMPEAWHSCIVAAIRYAENGGHDGIAYGIIPDPPKDPNNSVYTYEGQARWCSSTVAKVYERWLRGVPPPTWKPYLDNPTSGNRPVEDVHEVMDFIEYLGRIYAPHGAKNDPEGLNANWLKNVIQYFILFYWCKDEETEDYGRTDIGPGSPITETR